MEVILGKKAKLCLGAKDVALNETKEYNVVYKEIRRIARQVEIMVIIGKNQSQASNILYEIATIESRNAMLVEKIDDLYLNYIGRFKKVGIIAEKSTSKDLIDTVVEILKNTKTEEYMYEE